MTVLFYGEAQNKGSGAWCYSQTMHDRGFTVIQYSPYHAIQKYYSTYFFRAVKLFNRRQIPYWGLKKHRKDFKELAKRHKPDITIILKGLHHNHKDIVALKQFSKFVININHDDFFSLNPNNRSLRQLNAVSAYDFILTTREINVSEIRPYNKNVEFFKFAYFPLIHRESTLTKDEQTRFNCDILFVGTYESQRAILLEELMANKNYDLAIYGEGWNNLKPSSKLRQYIRSYKGLWMEDMAKAINVAKITLGFLRKENRDEYTQRTFEIPACGGVFLGERSQFHVNYFEEGKDAMFFDPINVDDLKEGINSLLTDEKLRRSIRAAGTNKVLTSNETYSDRIDRIVELYTKYKR